ncbi:MAG TPA: hypothetical protein VFT99_14780 [Roseiflexaceae bacterium]|nr:hypothetical protein [Roseiflexaceae bacterium]
MSLCISTLAGIGPIGLSQLLAFFESQPQRQHRMTFSAGGQQVAGIFVGLTPASTPDTWPDLLIRDVTVDGITHEEGVWHLADIDEWSVDVHGANG